MKNRAKCKLCGSIIESFHSTDFVSCKCGEITVDGGESLRCAAKDWKNFLRIDDEGNEIIVSVKGTQDVKPLYSENIKKPSKKEILDMLDEMIKNIENLPPQALTTPVNHYDLYSALALLSAALRIDCKD